LLGLVLTFSRGALLLGLPAAVLFMGFVAGGRWRWVALGLLSIGALLLLPLFGTERFAGLLDLQGGTSFFRVQLWRGAWNMVLDHPWLGVGLDNFLYAYRTTYALPTAWEELNLSHPHNIVLDFWTRLGFVGMVVGSGCSPQPSGRVGARSSAPAATAGRCSWACWPHWSPPWPTA
jgi:O-antigen ligase